MVKKGSTIVKNIGPIVRKGIIIVQKGRITFREEASWSGHGVS